MTGQLQARAGGPSDRSASRKVVSNSQFQMLSFAFRAISGIVVVILLARTGGPRLVGIVQFALTLTSLLPFYWGVPSLLAREVARRPEEGRRWVEVGTLIALGFGALFTVLLPAVALAVGASQETTLSILIATVGMVFDGVARVQFAAFWAWERMGLETLVTGVQEAAYLGLTVGVLVLGEGPLAVLGAFLASRVLGALWGWALAGRGLGGLPVPRARPEFLRRTVRQCTPFAISDTLTLTHSRFDTVLLGFWKGPVAVGLYQAATSLVLHFNTVARSVNRALYPRMGRAWPQRRDEFGRLRDISLRVIALVAAPISVASLLLAPRTIDFLYGADFAPVVLTYQLLALMIPIRMASNTMSLSLAATDRQVPRTVAVSVITALNLLLNIYAIPRWSYLGAAVSTLACQVGLLVIYAVLLRRAAGRSELLRSHVVPLLACVPMAAVILLTGGQHVLVSAAAALLAYGLAVAVMAAIRAPADRRRPIRALAVLVRPAR
ncbi:flippase [Geodermatophilus sp. SYSU D01176]